MRPDKFANIIANTGYYISLQKRPTGSFGFIGTSSIKRYQETATLTTIYRYNRGGEFSCRTHQKLNERSCRTR